MMIQDMKLRKCVYLMCSAMMTFLMVGCTQNEIPEVYPDGTGQIRFGVGSIRLGEEALTRAKAGYRNWNAESDPATMGVFGFCSGRLDGAGDGYTIFNNAKMTYQEDEKPWNYTPLEFWKTYFTKGRVDFISYMPYNEGVTLSKEGNDYTLTMPSMPYMVTDSKKLPLVCSGPVGYDSAYGHLSPVPMDYDQVYNKFLLQFKLDENMSKLRTFRIVKVEVKQIPYNVNIQQTYTFDSPTAVWTKKNTTYSATVDNDRTGVFSLAYPYDEDTKQWEGGLYLGYNQSNTDFCPFKEVFYMIPISGFVPQLDVTYIVYDEKGYETREITSSIILNNDNFPGISSMGSDKKNSYTLNIKIVPDHLYVLSDADQTAGVLVIKE